MTDRRGQTRPGVEESMTTGQSGLCEESMKAGPGQERPGQVRRVYQSGPCEESNDDRRVMKRPGEESDDDRARTGE